MRRDEEEDFHAFVTGRMERWRRSAYLLCQDWHTADDLVSVAVAKLYRGWRRASRAENRDAYAQRVLTRCWLDERRRPWRNRERSTAAMPDVAGVVPETVTDRDGLAALLRSLPPRQRAVLVLRFYLDHSVEETAQMLGISAGTVKSQSARGLANLRTAVNGQF
ncbi:RNA polymerase sigma-70 factor, sigma-E family [Micromonospora citrea]|uniref:RNA polymerase sigma-70 factor, sigma-E family n=1 Tax=Micromonospora citrea TaxID=47855 RepID=A0A1C6V507_9ACTN|nr:SigE family RNA polymerase sigma factor [Micromonospora citrea]SCL61134.1 RNA polymerase sigma-70 factor, sigma-E family [Micromonospora citrea]